MEKRAISLDQVLTASWKRMVGLLFKPFDFKKWLILGFCAWMTILIYDLASIQQRILEPMFQNLEQSESFNQTVHNIFKGTEGTLWSRLLQELEPYTGIICLIAALYIGYLILCLVVYWVRCRFEFVLLANLLRGTQEVRNPWREYRKIGNSYFIGSFLVNCLVFLYYMVILAILMPMLIAYLTELAAGEVSLPGPGIWICLGILLVSAIILGYYMWFFYQLLIPIMYRDKLTFRQGLRVMNRLIWKHFGICFLYYLVIMVVWFGFLIAVLAASALTCCIFLLLLTSVPYIRAVIVLPFWVFFRLLGFRLLEELDPRDPEPESGSGPLPEPESVPKEIPAEP